MCIELFENDLIVECAAHECIDEDIALLINLFFHEKSESTLLGGYFISDERLFVKCFG
ncbi:hypothetical protein D3C81_2160970 [compost metagenome]